MEDSDTELDINEMRNPSTENPDDKLTPEERERKALMVHLKYAEKDLLIEDDEVEVKYLTDLIASLKKQLGLTGGKSRKNRKSRKSRKRRFFSK